MTKEEYIAFHDATTKLMREVTLAKNADYTGSTNDPFANFKNVEVLGICSTEQGFATRMMDKISRIASFIKNGTLQVKDESASDTLIDLANYCILFAGYLESKKTPKAPAGSSDTVYIDGAKAHQEWADRVHRLYHDELPLFMKDELYD